MIETVDPQTDIDVDVDLESEVPCVGTNVRECTQPAEFLVYLSFTCNCSQHKVIAMCHVHKDDLLSWPGWWCVYCSATVSIRMITGI